MTELVLNDDQLELISAAEGPVMVRDRQGTEVGILSPVSPRAELSEEELKRINERMSADPQSFPTFREAIERLQTRA